MPLRSAKKQTNRHQLHQYLNFYVSTGSPSYQSPDFIHIIHPFVILLFRMSENVLKFENKGTKNTPQLSCKQVSIVVKKTQKCVDFLGPKIYTYRRKIKLLSTFPVYFVWNSRLVALFLQRLQHLFGKWTCCRRFLALPGLERWKDQAKRSIFVVDETLLSYPWESFLLRGPTFQCHQQKTQ